MARRVELWLAATALVLLLPYWLAWSLFEPVRNVDSQVYNLARLWVIEDGGLFLNRSYTATTQLIMPWSFDAVHYPTSSSPSVSSAGSRPCAVTARSPLPCRRSSPPSLSRFSPASS